MNQGNRTLCWTHQNVGISLVYLASPSKKPQILAHKHAGRKDFTKLRSWFTHLQVSKYVQADPVTVRVSDETQAHVGSGVVEVADQIHCLRTALGS